LSFIDQVELLVGQAGGYMYWDNRHNQFVDPKAYVGYAGAGTHVAAPGDIRLVSEPADLLQKLYAGVVCASGEILGRCS
jgi:hypothetical protein